MKIYCFDIDGVLIDRPKDSTSPDDYWAKPMVVNIAIVNKLYDKGHYIKLYTSRGVNTKIDWTKHTYDELKNFGIKYHEINFGKPWADYYIDDKMINIEDIKI